MPRWAEPRPGPADTVFTYLEPCRIMDTRNATAGQRRPGPLVGNQLYHYRRFPSRGPNWGRFGGNATSDCGLTSTIGGNIWAVAVVITILNPNFDAYFGVGDNNTLAATLSTVALNYTHGQGLSTQYIVPQGIANTIYFAMPAGSSANIIFDVVGYFAVSEATKLECQDFSIVAGRFVCRFNIPVRRNCRMPGRLLVHRPWCVETSLSSELNHRGLHPPGDCSWYNSSGTTIDASDLFARTTCCRVPGR